jgi:predicted TIM-barrel fold metal-dependent hydrolase
MRKCGNIYVETSNLAGQGYLEYMVREFGAERVMYGSFFPVNDPTVVQGMLLDADIDRREKDLVASGNLLRILDGARS